MQCARMYMRHTYTFTTLSLHFPVHSSLSSLALSFSQLLSKIMDVASSSKVGISFVSNISHSLGFLPPLFHFSQHVSFRASELTHWFPGHMKKGARRAGEVWERRNEAGK